MEEYPMPLIFCINLDERKDRWNAIQNLGKEVGIQIIRLPAEKADVGWKGCGLSHQKACRIAKMLDLPWVLVLEDDCVFTIESWNKFLSYLPTLWKKREKWNYFNGGPTYISWVSPWDKEMHLAAGLALTTHFTLYNSKFYDTVLNWNESKSIYDIWIRYSSHCIFGYPMIAVQNDGYSDIEGKYLSYAPIFDLFTTKIEEMFDIIFKEGFTGEIPDWKNITPTA